MCISTDACLFRKCALCSCKADDCIGIELKQNPIKYSNTVDRPIVDKTCEPSQPCHILLSRIVNRIPDNSL